MRIRGGEILSRSPKNRTYRFTPANSETALTGDSFTAYQGTSIISGAYGVSWLHMSPSYIQMPLPYFPYRRWSEITISSGLYGVSWLHVEPLCTQIPLPYFPYTRTYGALPETTIASGTYDVSWVHSEPSYCQMPLSNFAKRKEPETAMASGLFGVT
jgi:hypothetical protein